KIRQRGLGHLLLRFLNAALDLPYRIQVLAELGAVAPTELPLNVRNILAHEIDHASVFAQRGELIRGGASVAKQALEEHAGVGLGGERRGGRGPRETILVYARHAAIAGANGRRQIYGQLERRQAR